MAAGRRSGNTPSQQPQPKIPKLNTDPTWSLRSWPLDLTIAGCEFAVPAFPAADWIVAILGLDTDAFGLFQGLLSEEDSATLTDLVLAGEVEADDLVTLTMDLITTVSARPWWVTARLIGVVQANWDTLGAELRLKGVDPEALSLAAWLDIALLVAVRMMDPKDVTMFLMKLEMVPAQYADQVSEESLEISPDTFLSMAG